jgi:mRNA interferase HigB
MRIITERKLRDFWEDARGAERVRREKAMREWKAVVRFADWNSFADVRNTFNHSDVFRNCTIFDIGGNQYRIIAKLAYRTKLVFIRAVLTHSEYDEKKWQSDCK